MSTFGSHVGRMGAEPAGLGARGSLRRVKALWTYNWPYRRRSAVALVMMLVATFRIVFWRWSTDFRSHRADRNLSFT